MGHSTYRKTITQRLPIIIGYVVVHRRIPFKIGFSLGKSRAPNYIKKARSETLHTFSSVVIEHYFLSHNNNWSID